MIRRRSLRTAERTEGSANNAANPGLGFRWPVERLVQFFPDLWGHDEGTPVRKVIGSRGHSAADHVFVQRHPRGLQHSAHDPVLGRCHL